MYPGFLLILAYPIIALVVLIIMAFKREWTIVSLIIAVHLLLLFVGYSLYHE